MPASVILPNRGLLRLTGSERRDFLQGLISNDVKRLAPDRTLWSAFLTPQGKYLHDFFLMEQDEAVLLDVETPRAADLMRRLRMYKLRSDVALAEATADWTVAAAWGDGVAELLGLPATPGSARALESGGLAMIDPRLPEMGARLLLPNAVGDAAGALTALGLGLGEMDDWEAHRLSLGIPDGSRDLVVDKAILLENGFDELHGVDWNKGCYMGQELTARTRYRGLVKKRLLPVTFDGPPPPPGTLVHQENREAGELRSGRNGQALALLRLDALRRAEAGEGDLVADDRVLRPQVPAWMNITDGKPQTEG